MGGFLSGGQEPAELQAKPEVAAPVAEPMPEPVQTLPEQMPEPIPSASVEAAGQEEDEVALAERQALEEMKRAEQEQAQDHVLDEAKDQVEPNAATPSDSTQPTAPAKVKDEVDVEVGKILEDGLKDYYKEMDATSQARFKAKGDEVAGQVAVMVRGFKVNVKKVLELIRNWLLTIPRANKFFLEQEAKIKTDKVLEYEDFYHKQKNNMT